MATCCLLLFLVLCYFPLLLFAQSGIEHLYYGNCPLSTFCKKIGPIDFPFSNTTGSECGLPIRRCDYPYGNPEVQFGNEKWYEFNDTEPTDEGPKIIIVEDKELQKHLPKDCSEFKKSIPLFPNSSTYMKIFQIENSMTLYRCNGTFHVPIPESSFRSIECPDTDYYYSSIQPNHDNLDQLFPASSCSKIQVPFDREHFSPPNVNDQFSFLTAKLYIKVSLPEKCVECYKTPDICLDEGKYDCSIAKEKKQAVWKVMLIVGSVIAGAFVITIITLLIYKRTRSSSSFKYQSRNIDGYPHSNEDLECSRIFFAIPVFSYKELEEATNNFDRTRELGEGGFGTVYYGKLQDGREVAVKRLYEHNYRRVQQFMTEIEILTRLRHANLVTLYGCTSRHCRELLLVYEYIPNGTVACHLHGDLAKPGSLPWSVRMKIAKETASALAYLHASNIIHRDVKTNNILLDNHFCVKVADFGLSRLFPNDVTHVSTAPQGTPGYLDPEYYQCYQLTNKSDVYSFGVVLIELISSKPAVDITRHKDDINLAYLAVRKIQNSALSELVDPSLGFDSNNEVKRMIVSVAELAFQCLQLDRDSRPAMDQVLRMLDRIENGTDEQEHLEEEDLREVQISNSYLHPPPSLSPEHDEIGSSKNLKPEHLHQTM